MSTKTFDVNPVIVGLDSLIEIEFPQDIIDALDLQSGTLTSDFRERKNQTSERFARKTTDDGITWDQNILRVDLTSVETSEITGEAVFFDFIHELEGKIRKVPGDWEWPVERTVTDPNG